MHQYRPYTINNFVQCGIFDNKIDHVWGPIVKCHSVWVLVVPPSLSTTVKNLCLMVLISSWCCVGVWLPWTDLIVAVTFISTLLQLVQYFRPHKTSIPCIHLLCNQYVICELLKCTNSQTIIPTFTMVELFISNFAEKSGEND